MSNFLPKIGVFDTVISQNIDLCNLFYQDENATDFIYIKNGFHVKTRDLSNQIFLRMIPPHMKIHG